MPAPSRRHFIATAATAIAWSRASALTAPWAAALALVRPVPTPSQLAWQRDELAMFNHFGVNTFTDREWGDGTEDPAMFNPARFDARQWARAAKAAGFRAMILTAKHHDGFCLWPTSTTKHSVASSPFRSGHGDVVREFVDACRAEHLRAGLYLSPWDRHEPRYGDSRAYNDFYCDQLREFLTRYGDIAEVWFDGANGEGPNGKKQTYDWPRVWSLVRTLQRKAVMFSDAGPDVRWIGNENGAAGETNWSMQDPLVVPVPGLSGRAVTQMLQQGDPHGSVWRPGETDVSIRPGWFHHPAEDGRVKSIDQLVNLYFTSVGRNSKLLLNVPPTRDGLLHDTDMARLSGMRTKLDALLSADVTRGRKATWRTGPSQSVTTIDLGRPTTVSIAALAEDVSKGQFVARYTLEVAGEDGVFAPVSHGTTIGYKKLDRFAATPARHVRLTAETTEAEDPLPRQPVRLQLYSGL